MKSCELVKGERYRLNSGRIVWYDGCRVKTWAGDKYIEYEFHDVGDCFVGIKEASFLDEIKCIRKY